MESDLEDQALSLQNWVLKGDLGVANNFAFSYAERRIRSMLRNVDFTYTVNHVFLRFWSMIDQGVLVNRIGWNVALSDLVDKSFNLRLREGSAGFVFVVAEDPFALLSCRRRFKSASGLELSDLVVFFSRLVAAVILLLNGNSHQNSNQRSRRISDSAVPQMMFCHNHTHVRDSAEAPDRRLRMHPPDQLSLSCSE